MIQFKTAPLQNKSMQVQTTTNYNLFKTLEGNRQTNKLHLRRLKKSMSELCLVSPIVVNEDMYVIDGQHRLVCLTELELPVHYIVCEGYGLKEVQVLNVNSKNWSSQDYMNGYCEVGLKDYITYREFKNRYKFSHTECVSLLTGGYGGSSVNDEFNNGLFKIKDEQKAHNMAEKINALAPLYDGYNRRSFIYALIFLFKNPLFRYDEFVQKLKQQQGKMYDCAKTSQYIDLIEEIYNYRRQNKVNLRY
jgi:hypothetical protein